MSSLCRAYRLRILPSRAAPITKKSLNELIVRVIHARIPIAPLCHGPGDSCRICHTLILCRPAAGRLPFASSLFSSQSSRSLCVFNRIYSRRTTVCICLRIRFFFLYKIPQPALSMYNNNNNIKIVPTRRGGKVRRYYVGYVICCTWRIGAYDARASDHFVSFVTHKSSDYPCTYWCYLV